MNFTLFLGYIAIGALSRLLVIKDPSPGRRVGLIVELLLGGLLIAFIAQYPPKVAAAVIIATPHLAHTFGHKLGDLVDWVRTAVASHKVLHGRSL